MMSLDFSHELLTFHVNLMLVGTFILMYYVLVIEIEHNFQFRFDYIFGNQF